MSAFDCGNETAGREWSHGRASSGPSSQRRTSARFALSLVVVLLGLVGARPVSGQANAPGAVPIDLRTEASRSETVRALNERASEAKLAAESQARQRGWTIRGVLPGSRHFELIDVVNELPRYYVTHNANAAISTAANLVRNAAPYNVNGSGYIVGVWDGGAVLSTHQEFGVRVLVKDGAGFSDHATHVAGTIGAAGIVAAAQGMAPSVGIDSYDWDNDYAEMTGRAATAPAQASNIYLSNHSYGFIRGWETGSFSGSSGFHWFGRSGEREDRGFGIYDASTVALDTLHYNAPYYLAFKSAGNDRNDPGPATGATYFYFNNGAWVAKAYNPATDPFTDGWDAGGYDTIEQQGVAKNIMTVGAVNDAVSGGVRAPANGTMSTFSNWGPTDDGRIKPDIVANGVSLYSPVSTSSSSYSTFSGTSMSSPNAAGSAALLVDYYGELFPGGAMRASTLKGLLIHTADDLGTAGPDYAYGWGLINTVAAAAQLKSHSDAPTWRFVHEGLLTSATPSESFAFAWNGTSAIRATLCWTDPAGTAKSGLDNRTPALVNDLDLRIIAPDGAVTHLPFVLNVNSPASAATTGDNVVDNVEQIRIPSPVAGTYTLVVSRKGTLVGAQQYYSLILNGQSLQQVPAVSVVASDATAGEPSSGQGSGTFTFSRSGSTGASLVITYGVSGTATSGSDFTALGTSVTFPAGAATVIKQVDVLDDSAVEGNETVVVTVAAGAGYTVGSPASATVTIADDDAVGTQAFVTGFVAGTLRNNYSGWVGMQVLVGAAPVNVKELGRIMAPGNSGTHTVKLVKLSDGQDVPGGAVSLAMSGGTVGQIKYATLASPVVLAANTAYLLMTQETFGGDTWYDLNTTVTTTGVAAVNTAAYGSGPGAWVPFGGANQTYGPVNFKYDTVSGPPTRIIALSGSLAFGTVAVGGTAQSTLTIANNGNAALTVSGITYPGGFSGNWSSGTIPAGGAQPVTVTFAPTAATAYVGNISVSSDATSGVNTIAASGTGTTSTVATAYVTSHVAGNLRNNYSGWVGMQLTVGAAPVSVNELGRIMAPGNSGTHAVKLVKVSDGQDVPGGTVSLAMSGGTVGQFKYTPLAGPVVLAANTAYLLMTQETFGGDTWYDVNTTVSTTGVAVVNTGAYGSGPGAWFAYGGGNQSYGPVNFKYETVSGPPTRIIALSGNLAFGSVAVGGTAQSTLTITNNGNAALTVSGITYPGGFSGNWSSGTIPAGGAQPVTVTFAPTVATAYSGTITVNSDATSGVNTIAASGTGTTSTVATAYVTSHVAGNLRNNYSGWVGMQITVGGAPLNVKELGRIMAPGNSGTHTVKLVKVSDGLDVPGGSVSLAMSGGTVGQIKYATLASPVVLAANTAYLLMTQETFGGDTWYDVNTTITTTGVAVVNTAAYGSGPGAWFAYGGGSQTYGPVGFKY